MKTPLRQPWTLPARYTVSDEPYEIDWTALLEDGETIAADGVKVTTVRGDTVADRVETLAGVTTFWLSGGSTSDPVHQLLISPTTSLGETDAVVVTITVLG